MFRARADTPDFTALARDIDTFKQANGLPSATAIAVVKDGRIIYEGYFGLSDIEARTPASHETTFYIASATKPFFALNALMKEGTGQLDMHTSLQGMFPGLRFNGFDARAVTLADLLTHVSGVDNQPLVWATAFTGIHDAHSRLALVAASYRDADTPRGTFKYSNVGYNIASVWMDRQFAMPWQDQLEEAIFQPLSMSHTSARISTALAGGWLLAKPYSFASAQPTVPLYLAKADDTMHAAGGIVSTAPDLARFLIAELAHDASSALPGDVITRSHVSQIALTAKYLDFERSGYAWGWYIGKYKGRTMLHHFGGFSGFHAHLSFMPDAGIGLVVLNNEDVLGAQVTSVIADAVYGMLLGEADTAARASQRFQTLQAKATEVSRAAARHRAIIRARGWTLSRPLKAYAGTYSNALLGDISVRLDANGVLALRWGRLAALATAGEQHDQIRVEFAPGSGEFLEFKMGSDGVDAIVFDQMTFERNTQAPNAGEQHAGQ